MGRKSTADTLYRPKGMRDLLGQDFYAYQGFFEKAAEVAAYYGFSPIQTPILEKEELFRRTVGEHTDIVEKEMYVLKTGGGDRLALRPEGTVPTLRAYFENGLQSETQPVMLYYYGPFLRHDKPQRGRLRQLHQFGLEIIGTSKSIADALIIKLSLLILAEAGLDKVKVEINSIGDRECRPIFRRELVNYYKKQIRQICADCRDRLKHNPLRLLDCKEPRCQEIKAEAPSPITYLCNGCKAHFREVLEYLEMVGVTYEINNNLVRGLDYYARTVFEIFETESTPVPAATANKETKNKETKTEKKEEESAAAAPTPLALAAGGRYDGLSRALGQHREVPAVGVAIGVDRVLSSPHSVKVMPRLLKKPKVFFIQLSFDAKLKSLEIIENLRKAKIPLAQSLPKDSLAAQLAIAEKMGIPYALILGQKEALDNTVIVRQMLTRSQETVKINKLAAYLKQLK